ncbi:hypothetical protein L9F63_012997 [Diploptera punctata]|uniref:Uncharacterized protein n=1 Tax=Diploptera punctata TaxID=6984 RepID=A0AAD8EML4_DIPPU|nr:hypothetical protein L9F63_012997 [Diploptera punctata]
MVHYVAGKGESIWDSFLHAHPEAVADHTNGDIAADFYHKYKEDVQRIKSLRLSAFRFSISWPRIMPTGMLNSLNQEGINFYNDLINELIANGITPIITMYHWDLPQKLQDLGGWTNKIISEYFEDYADILFKCYGDRVCTYIQFYFYLFIYYNLRTHNVKWWVTINEPTKITEGYGGNETGLGYPPNASEPGIGPYLAGHNMLLSHARVYHLYDRKYRVQQKGYITIVLETFWFEPLDNSSQADHDAAKQTLEFNLGWFANPIYSEEGDYPQIMKDIISNNSKKEGFRRSRLPEFTKDELQLVRGSTDYFGLNQYTTNKVTFKEVGLSPSRARDIGVQFSVPEFWPTSETSKWEKVVPKGLRKLLKYIQDTYGKNFKIFITENGYIDDGRIEDVHRMIYIATYMMETWKAMYLDEVNVIGYTIWSLLDNVEWTSGYRSKAGIFRVDFNSSDRTRTPKYSTLLVKQITATRCIPKNYVNYLNQLNDLEFT